MDGIKPCVLIQQGIKTGFLVSPFSHCQSPLLGHGGGTKAWAKGSLLPLRRRLSLNLAVARGSAEYLGLARLGSIISAESEMRACLQSGS